jgi:hypothetical protein
MGYTQRRRKSPSEALEPCLGFANVFALLGGSSRIAHLHDMSGELDRLRVSQLPSETDVFLRLKQYSRTTRPHADFDAKHLIDGIAERGVLGRWRLCEMKAGDDPELLSWATEYLSANVHTHDAPPLSHRRTWTHRKSHWAEADGSCCTLGWLYILSTT